MPVSDAQVAAFRHFNRFYTRQIGVLDRGFLHSDFSLTEVRVLYELAHRGTTTAGELGAMLGIDAGYLSRMLRAFRRRGLVTQRTSARDRRARDLALTARGRAEFARLDALQRADVQRVLDPLGAEARRSVLEQLAAVERVLGTTPPPNEIRLRRHRPGDMGWITHRQAVLYFEEYGWNEQYEALIARIMADFIDRHDPDRERCWVAERAGEIVGSVFCVRKSSTIAKLRLLYVEPSARGTGLGTRLVRECIRFARSVGYRTLTLWTNNVLVAARRIYEREGFALVAEDKHRSFGKSLVGQTWKLDLRQLEDAAGSPRSDGRR